MMNKTNGLRNQILVRIAEDAIALSKELHSTANKLEALKVAISAISGVYDDGFGESHPTREGAAEALPG